MLSRFEKFVFNITEVDLYYHRIASYEMKKYGLKGTYALYFTQLYHHPEGLTAIQLGMLCGKDKADVSRDLNVLEKNGFIEKHYPDQKIKGYRALVTLTETGMKITNEIVQKASKAVEIVGRTLKDEDRDVFYRVFDEITANLETLSLEGLPEVDHEKD